MFFMSFFLSCESSSASSRFRIRTWHQDNARDKEEIKVKEPIGAGDALVSGFVAGLILGKDIESSLRIGMANSESVVQKIGATAGILRKSDIEDIPASKHILRVL